MVVLLIVKLHHPLPLLWILVKFDSSLFYPILDLTSSLTKQWTSFCFRGSSLWSEEKPNSTLAFWFCLDSTYKHFVTNKLLQASNSFGWHYSLWFSYSWPIQASSALLASQHFWGCTICNRQNPAPSSRLQFTPYLIEQNMNLIYACKFTLGICNG